MNVKLSITPLLAKLELKNNKRYTVASLSREVMLSRRITDDLFFKSPEQIRMITLAKILTFFHREGMPITINDLFVVESEQEQAG